MWMVLGIAAIASAILNLIWAFNRKNAQWFRFASLSLTSLTLCAFYTDGAGRVVAEDWCGLMDIKMVSTLIRSRVLFPQIGHRTHSFSFMLLDSRKY